MPERNVYIVGAHSSGKTTLAKAFYDHLLGHSDPGYHSGEGSDCTFVTESPHTAPQLITEVARSVVERSGISRADIRSSKARCLELQRRILEAQFEAETSATSWIISDRSAADPLAYADFHVDNASGENLGPAVKGLVQQKEWQILRDRMKQGLVIVTAPVPGFLVDDGTRLVPLNNDEWWKFHQRFCELLEIWGISYEVLGEEMLNLENRVQFVLDKIRSKHFPGNK